MSPSLKRVCETTLKYLLNIYEIFIKKIEEILLLRFFDVDDYIQVISAFYVDYLVVAHPSNAQCTH